MEVALAAEIRASPLGHLIWIHEYSVCTSSKLEYGGGKLGGGKECFDERAYGAIRTILAGRSPTFPDNDIDQNLVVIMDPRKPDHVELAANIRASTVAGRFRINETCTSEVLISDIGNLKRGGPEALELIDSILRSAKRVDCAKKMLLQEQAERSLVTAAPRFLAKVNVGDVLIVSRIEALPRFWRTMVAVVYVEDTEPLGLVLDAKGMLTDFTLGELLDVLATLGEAYCFAP